MLEPPILLLEGLNLKEFLMDEPIPLVTIQAAVLEFIKGRTDVVLFGAMAVNAYVIEPRMTEDVDIQMLNIELVEILRQHLNTKFNIAVRVREIKGEAGTKGFRLYQLRKEKNRHLVDIRPILELPSYQLIQGIQVVAPAHLLASKLISSIERSHTPKGFTDGRDILILLLTFPEFRTDDSQIKKELMYLNADERIYQAWEEWRKRPLPRNSGDELDEDIFMDQDPLGL